MAFSPHCARLSLLQDKPHGGVYTSISHSDGVFPYECSSAMACRRFDEPSMELATVLEHLPASQHHATDTEVGN